MYFYLLMIFRRAIDIFLFLCTSPPFINPFFSTLIKAKRNACANAIIPAVGGATCCGAVLVRFVWGWRSNFLDTCRVSRQLIFYEIETFYFPGVGPRSFIFRREADFSVSRKRGFRATARDASFFGVWIFRVSPKRGFKGGGP